MVSADHVNDHAMFLWNCLKSAQENGGKVNNKTISQLYNIKPNAVHMRLFRLSKVIEAMGEAQGGDDVGNDNDHSANAAFPKVKTMDKAGGAGTAKGQKRKAEEVNFYEDTKDEEDAQPKPRGKVPKLSPAEIKVEAEDEDKAGYYNGGTATDDENGGI